MLAALSHMGESEGEVEEVREQNRGELGAMKKKLQVLGQMVSYLDNNQSEPCIFWKNAHPECNFVFLMHLIR